EQARIAADLSQAQKRRQNRYLRTLDAARCNLAEDFLAAFVQYIQIKRALVFLQIAQIDDVCAFGQFLLHLTLQTAQNVGVDDSAQSLPPALDTGLDGAFECLVEFFVGAAEIRHQEIEERPQFFEAVLDRRAGKA